MQLSRNYFTPIILYFDTTLQITCGINFYTKQKYKKKKNIDLNYIRATEKQHILNKRSI